MTEVYDRIDDLKKFGVLPQTGEACGVSMRTLCDLTEKGCDLIREFMRVEPTADAWNSKGIKSIMIPNILFQELWIFAHIRANTKYVFLGDWCMGDQWTETKYEEIHETLWHPVKSWVPRAYAIDCDEEMAKITRHENKSFYISRWYHKSTHPGTGIDNIHAMSGRTY